MILEFSIKNFKGFRDSRKLKMKPLTFIYGPNSSGKSSIIHALMLLKQSFTKPTKNSGLVSNGDYIDLGSYLTMVNQHNTDLNIEFSIKYTPIKYNISSNHNLQSYFGSKYDREYDFVFELFKDETINNGKVFSFLKEISFKVKNIDDNKNKIHEDFLDLKFTSRLENDGKIKFKDALLKVQDYKYKSEVYAKNHADFLSKRVGFIDKTLKQSKIVFEHIRYTNFIKDQTFATPSAVTFEVDNKKDEKVAILRFMEAEAGRSLYDLSRELKDKFNSISYLGPLRSYPERIYTITEDYKNSVGKLGENIANLLCIDNHDILMALLHKDFITI
ncbi:AAA family ATPase [Acinetobacter bereziniae]|uniref:AAA family ATPase n=1 Tax=Acinetobacter bereziniae TaxID=106648 RepID=UPI0021D04B31|nr:AAA family ATPase [Acinetobacter bereziniae]MCU4599328.1 AAA family ATPase [Acinetobacter bereziniae]